MVSDLVSKCYTFGEKYLGKSPGLGNVLHQEEMKWSELAHVRLSTEDQCIY